MKKKKVLSKAQKKEIRLRKARQWLLTYTGSSKNMTKCYREHLHVDVNTAVRDLQKIGVVFTQEYLDNLKTAETEQT